MGNKQNNTWQRVSFLPTQETNKGGPHKKHDTPKCGCLNIGGPKDEHCPQLWRSFLNQAKSRWSHRKKIHPLPLASPIGPASESFVSSCNFAANANGELKSSASMAEPRGRKRPRSSATCGSRPGPKSHPRNVTNSLWVKRKPLNQLKA